MRIPTMNSSESYCDWCVGTEDGLPLCVEVCSTEALKLPASGPVKIILTTYQRLLKKAKMHDRDTRLLCNLVGKTNSELYISYCSHAAVDDAMRWNLKIDRVRLDEQGKRVCLIGPSDFLSVMRSEKENCEFASVRDELPCH